MAMVTGPATTTRLTPMVMAAVTAIQLPDTSITPLSDAISLLARVFDASMPPVLASGVIGSKKPTIVSSPLF